MVPSPGGHGDSRIDLNPWSVADGVQESSLTCVALLGWHLSNSISVASALSHCVHRLDRSLLTGLKNSAILDEQQQSPLQLQRFRGRGLFEPTEHERVSLRPGEEEGAGGRGSSGARRTYVFMNEHDGGGVRRSEAGERRGGCDEHETAGDILPVQGMGSRCNLELRT